MAKNKVKNPDKLGFGRLMAWKSSDVVAGWINLLALTYLSVYCSDTLGIDVMVVGTMLMVSKIVDAFTDVAAGILVDNTHTKMGKGRPYELCIVGMTLCTIALYSCPTAWSTTLKCVWIFCMYTLTFSIFTTLRQAAGTPYTIRHFSNNPVLLRKIASYGGIITMAGSMVMSIAFPILMARIATSAAGWTTLIAAIMVPATFLGLLRFLFCKEDPNVDAGTKQEPIRFNEIKMLLTKNKYVWFYAIIMLAYNVITGSSVGTYYFKWVLGDISLMSVFSMLSMVMLPVMLIFPVIMKKIGSMSKMVLYFSVIGVAAYVVIFFLGTSFPVLIACGLLTALSTTPLAYYGVLFIMNICSYNEMNDMPRMDGSSGILANFASKFGGSLGVFITGAMMSAAGYISQEGVAAQPDSAILMIRVCYALVPAILLVVIAYCCYEFSKLEPKVNAFEAEKKAKLAAPETTEA